MSTHMEDGGSGSQWLGKENGQNKPPNVLLTRVREGELDVGWLILSVLLSQPLRQNPHPPCVLSLFKLHSCCSIEVAVYKYMNSNIYKCK